MKRLVIISTKVGTGKGGISTALLGYINGLNDANIEFDYIESHNQERNMLLNWLSAFVKVVYFAFIYRGKGVFWFHGGPWLSMLRKSSLAIIPRLLRCETVIHIHSPTFNTYLSQGGIPKFLLKCSLAPYTKIIVLTPWWEKLLKSHGITKDTLISPNPNNQEYCDVAKQYLISPRTINHTNNRKILTMSRLVKGKGVELVIESMTKLPDSCYLTIAGEGSYKNELIALVKSLNLQKRVTFVGWINGSQKEALLRTTDVFCLPSTYDSFGMVFIEAMAFDVPVVAYGWGPICDVVSPDVGECCDNSTVEDVAKALSVVFSQLANYRGKGPKKVLSQYTPKVITKNITKWLK